MYFNSISELIHMAGHGAYVWSAYLITAIVVLSLVVMPLMKTRKFLRHQHLLQRSHAKQEHHPPKHRVIE